MIYTQNKTAANIAFVSFHSGDDSPSGDAAGAGFSEAVDRGYTDFLTASGHNVTRIETSGNPDVSALNDYDLVILSRSNPSGNFRNDAGILWHSVTAPTLILNGYLTRSSRLGLTEGSTMVDTTGVIQLKAEDAAHPLFEGILDGNGVTGDYAGIITYSDVVQRGVSVNNDALSAGVPVCNGGNCGRSNLGGPIAAE